MQSPSYPLSPTPDSKRDDLIETLLASTIESGRHLYAILDLAALDNPQDWLQRMARHPGARNLFAPQPEASAETLAAWLIPLNNMPGQRRLLRQLVTEALQADCATWLVSPLETGELTRRLSQRLTARVQDGEALFRYYDPRLLGLLYELFGPEQRGTFFALGQSWSWLDSDGRLQGISLTVAPTEDPFSSPIQITVSQQQALQALSERHQLANFLYKRRAELLATWGIGRALAFVTEHDELAASEGVVRFPDRLNFCLHALDTQGTG